MALRVRAAKTKMRSGRVDGPSTVMGVAAGFLYET